MRVYVDSSALLKRVFDEPESEALVGALRRHAEAGDVLVSSSLAWVEVSRAIRAQAAAEPDLPIEELSSISLSGLLEKPIDAEVVALARRLPPLALRSLDALHLASAILVDADRVVVYDERLAVAARDQGLTVVAPG